MYIFSKYLGVDRSRAVERVNELLDFMSISHKAQTSIQSLSGGMQRRLVFVRALLGNPDLIILDEPTTGLHFADVQKLLDVLNRLVNLGNTVVVIEHNMDVIKVADHIIDLGPEGGFAGGQIIAEGTPEEIAGAAVFLAGPSGSFVTGQTLVVDGGTPIQGV